MIKKVLLMACAILLVLPAISSAMSERQSYKVPEEVISGAYRHWWTYNTTIEGSEDDSGEEEIEFPFDDPVGGHLILVSWDDATNPLHIQFFTTDGDSTYIRPSYVAWVEPGETFPFYMRDIDKIKVDSVVADDDGQIRVNWYKI